MQHGSTRKFKGLQCQGRLRREVPAASSEHGTYFVISFIVYICKVSVAWKTGRPRKCIRCFVMSIKITVLFSVLCVLISLSLKSRQPTLFQILNRFSLVKLARKPVCDLTTQNSIQTILISEPICVCVRACVRACVSVCVCACVCVCVCVWAVSYTHLTLPTSVAV